MLNVSTEHRLKRDVASEWETMKAEIDAKFDGELVSLKENIEKVSWM